jgi:hypothetical protein
VLANPGMAGRFLAGQNTLSQELTHMVALRMGADPLTDQAPALMVAAVLAATQVSLGAWLHSDRSFTEVLTESLDALGHGLDHLDRTAGRGSRVGLAGRSA